jgi:hypothetical protein
LWNLIIVNFYGAAKSKEMIDRCVVCDQLCMGSLPHLQNTDFALILSVFSRLFGY